jgi:hypothetical protein
VRGSFTSISRSPIRLPRLVLPLFLIKPAQQAVAGKKLHDY